MEREVAQESWQWSFLHLEWLVDFQVDLETTISLFLNVVC